MKDWQPVAELERLLDALESQLLSATDEEIRDALGRRQPAGITVQAVSNAVAISDWIGWPPGVTSLQGLGQPVSLGLQPREH
jgi:hypothetical protein